MGCELTEAPYAADLLAEWLKIYWPTTTLEVTSTTIVIHWPLVLAKNGQFVTSKLTLTIPERGLFKVDDVWVTDPKFFAQFEAHLNKQRERLKVAVDKYVETGIMPDQI